VKREQGKVPKAAQMIDKKKGKQGNRKDLLLNREGRGKGGRDKKWNGEVKPESHLDNDANKKEIPLRGRKGTKRAKKLRKEKKKKVLTGDGRCRKKGRGRKLSQKKKKNLGEKE